MKKNLFMTAAAIAALLTGCSTDEEIANIETSAKNAIGFNIVSNSAETKATIYNNGSTNFDFDVFAFNSTTGKLFMGNQSNEYAHDGVKIYHNGTKWDYKNPDNLAYWPTNSLDFYAVSPASFNEDLLGFFTWLMHSDQQKISYTTVDEFETGNKNLDVMYAVRKNQKKDTNNGIVKLQFKHTLSQVLFKAKVQYESMEVSINEMKIKSFYMGGTFTFPTDDTNPTNKNWAYTDEQHTSGGYGFTVKKNNGTDITVSSTTEGKWITTEDDPMLFIPQQLTAWSTTPETAVSIETAKTNKHSFLEITMKLTQNGQYLIGTESSYQTIYVPFTNVDATATTGWEPGKRYIYTLIFGGGYDKNGNPILTPITFEPSVEDWKDISGYTPDVPAYTN